MVTNGHRIFGTRFSSNPEKETRTLYYSTGDSFQCKDGASRMLRNGSKIETVLIVSEKLNKYEDEWTAIPQNNFIAVDQDLEVHLSPLVH
jgi:predicted glutamine amidotransferase